MNDYGDDIDLKSYLNGNKKADEAIYYMSDGGYLMQPYYKGLWLEDKIFFPTKKQMESFCKDFGIVLYLDEA